MRTALRLLVPSVSSAFGVAQKTFQPAEGVILGSVKMRGGVEIVKNDVLSVEESGDVTCWFRPDITAGCRFEVIGAGVTLEIIGEPENVDMYNQFLLCKVRRVKGGA